MDQYASYVVEARYITETAVEGKRLGRHVRHDSRSLGYRYAGTGDPLKTTLMQRYIPIFNQGQVGDCTMNAGVGSLGTGKMWLSLTQEQQASLNEQLCVAMYSSEEALLFGSGYPPTDNGGDGLTAAKVMQQDGYISGYTHCLALNDVLEALSNEDPLSLGINWYDSFDQPDSNGIITISPSAQVRGGHEVLARGININDQLIFCDNSWGPQWGLSGSFEMSWDTLAQLLGEQGDGTVPTPNPAVTPV